VINCTELFLIPSFKKKVNGYLGFGSTLPDDYEEIMRTKKPDRGKAVGQNTE